MLAKLSLILLTTFALSACASGENEAKRLGECIIDGNVNNNCELSTIEHGHNT